jgi:hypothetical protein
MRIFAVTVGLMLFWQGAQASDKPDGDADAGSGKSVPEIRQELNSIKADVDGVDARLQRLQEQLQKLHDRLVAEKSIIAARQAEEAKSAPTKPKAFDDVDTKSWAYPALDTLAQHKLLLGYPHGYFAGKRVATRYEFAVATGRVLASLYLIGNAMPTDNSVGINGPPFMLPSLSDLMIVQKLAGEFHAELQALGYDFKVIDSRLPLLLDKARKKESAAAPKTGETAAPSAKPPVHPAS